jgi:hypothetical protein
MTNKELNLKILEIVASKESWQITELLKNVEKLQKFVFGIQESTDADTVTDDISVSTSNVEEVEKPSEDIDN